MENGLKEKLKIIFESALAAVAPEKGLQEHLSVVGKKISVDGKEYNIGNGRIFVIGAGKGAAPMAVILENMLGDEIFKGVVAVKYDHDLPLGKLSLMQASHPVPDGEGVKAAHACLNLARESNNNDLLICLFTGGASALLPCPAHGATLEEVQEATRLLLGSGANIYELNAIRKHLSEISGGQVAEAAKAQVVSLIVSDVIGDDMGVIASGPTSPDPSTFSDCLEIVKKYGLKNRLPFKIMEILIKGAEGKISETPKPGASCFDRVQNVIIASNRQALMAAEIKAKELDLDVQILENAIQGEAREEALKLIEYTRKTEIPMDKKGCCVLAGGETTVQIKGNGLGGRNQEMALQASLLIEGDKNMGALFAGTDGTDGPTDANGGFAFANTVEKMGGRKEAEKYLAENDSYHALKKADDLFITGPTRTNVMDIAIIIKMANS